MILLKRRLLSQLSKLKQNDEVAKQYDNVIKEQLNLGIIERVEEEASTVTYLPHREILKPDRETTKICVVFDLGLRANCFVTILRLLPEEGVVNYGFVDIANSSHNIFREVRGIRFSPNAKMNSADF